MIDYLDDMARMISNTKIAKLDQNVANHVCQVFLDTLGAVIAGGKWSHEVPNIVNTIERTTGNSVVFVEGFPRRGASQAALLNGSAGTWLELEEGNRIAGGHPAIHVFPATLAIAQELDVSGEQVLDAFFVGYEAASRMGTAANMRAGYHPHGTWGTIGAAAAVARLMELNEKKIRETINVASALTLASPFSAATEGATVRNLFAGVAGANGILAARTVNNGITGLSDGPREVFSRLSGNHFDPEVGKIRLDGKWAIEKNYFKAHGYCRHNHAAIEALMNIHDIEKVFPEKIRRIVIYTHAPASDMRERHPASDLAARFSIPYSIAARLVLGKSDETATSQEALRNQKIKQLLKVTEIYEDKTYTRRYPQFRDARVELFLEDEQILVGRCENPPGDMDLDPYTHDFVENKFMRITQPLLGDASELLLSRCTHLREISNVNQLFDGF